MDSTKKIKQIAKKHQTWITIVISFGAKENEAEDIVQSMYLKIIKKLDEGLNIDFNDDYNYFYIFKTLRSIFLDIKRKESKMPTIPIDNVQLTDYIDEDKNIQKIYEKIEKELDTLYWYDKKVFQLIQSGESIASLSRKTGIAYHSLYKTYISVKSKMKKLLWELET